MRKTNGFVDLRIGHGAAGIGDDSVWPSFTDIMTVIVMIFLMTLVVIMVRNFGLSSELLTNISAREAIMLANQDLARKNTELEASLQSTETERVSLSVSLAQTLERIASLAEDQLELQADLESMTAARKELEQATVRLQQTQLETSVKVEGLTADTEGLTRQKADLEAALQSTEAERSSLAESLKQARERIVLLVGSKRGLQDEVALLTAARKELEQANAQLQQTQLEILMKVESLTADTEVLTQQKADLVAELQSAEAELQSTKAELQSTKAERSSLVESLKQAHERIASLTESERGLQDELVKLTANELLLTRNIGSLDDTLAELKIQSEAQISSLIDERATLEDRIYTLSEQLEHLRRLLSRSNLEKQLLTQEMAQVERINESAAERYTRVTDEILSLKELIEQREVEIVALKASVDTSVREYRSLQEEYESLDVQYRKLVRPARSSVAKTVVEVRVEKIAGTLSYEIKRSSDSELVPVSRSQLDSTLQNLKNRLGKSLYTKIVIPDGSNLTFNEAWGFTWDILRKYDYYYQ